MFISTAFAQTAGAADASSLLLSYAPIVLIFGVFYFLVIRPQNMAAKQHATLLSGLKKQDKVLTQSGLMGKVDQVAEHHVLLKVNAEDHVLMAKESVLRLLGETESAALETLLKGK